MKIRSQTSELSDFSPFASGEQSPLPATNYPDACDEHNFDDSHKTSKLVDNAHSVMEEAHIPTHLLTCGTITQPLKSRNIWEKTKMERAKSADVNSPSESRIRRRQEQLAHGERRIAPKAREETAAAAATLSRLSSSDHSMVRVKSADGRFAEKYQISKTAYTRPPRAKVRCTLCNEHPEGFRGEHELRRHTDRSHTSVRKVWVCVDGSTDKTMLSRCKACRARKPYGAYYNAAAHLRRVHFNPKDKGRKTRGSSERAGKGGGDWPPMEKLKRDWIREVEEKVPIDFEDDEGFNEELADRTSGADGTGNEYLSTPAPADSCHLTSLSASTAGRSYSPDLGSSVPRHPQLGLDSDPLLHSMADASWYDGVFDFDVQPSSDSLHGGFDESLLYTMQSY